VERKIIIEDMLQRLIERIKKAGYEEHWIRRAKELINELQRRGIYGIDRFVKKLSDRANEKQDYLDILREGRFAIILVRNNFSEITFIKEERRRKLPDMKTNWNRNTIYFEVTRSRPSEDDVAIQAGAAFVSQDSIENIIGKIREKLPQLQSGGINIVVIWSDTINWLPPIMEEAFKYIQREVNQNPGVYEKLSGVLFTESGEAIYPSEFKLFKNNEALKPLRESLAVKLESLGK